MLRSRALAFLSRSPSRATLGLAVTVVSSVVLVHCGQLPLEPVVGDNEDSGSGAVTDSSAPSTMDSSLPSTMDSSLPSTMNSSVSSTMDSTVAPPVDSGGTPISDADTDAADANIDAGVDSGMTIGTGVVGVSPSSIYFGTLVGGGDDGGGPLEGTVPCGMTAPQAGVCLTNSSSTTYTWSATFPSGSSYYSASPSSGSVLGGKTSCSSPTFYVNPAKVPFTSSVMNDLYAGTVEITTNAPGDGAHLVQLHETAAGVILSATNASNQTNFTTLTLPSTAVDVTSTAQFTLTNTGNLPLTGATLTNVNTVFAVNPAANLADGGVEGNPQLLPIALTPDNSLTATVAFTPTAVNASGYTDTAVYTIPNSTVLCQPLPPNFTLNGTATDGVSVTTVGGFSANCNGAAAAPQTFKLSNKGGPATFSASFQTGFFTLEGPEDDGGTAPIPTNTPQYLPSGSITLTVVPLPIAASTPPGAHNDVLSITTSAAGDTGITHTIPLNETAMGAALAFSQSTGFNFSPGLGKIQTQAFTVTNTGNLQASYSLFIMLSQGNDSEPWAGDGGFPVAPLPPGAAALSLAPLASTTSCNGTAACYPQIPLVCSAYSQSNAYPNECQPTGGGADCLGTVNLPEFCLSSNGGSLYGTLQSGASGPTSANITLDVTGYPSSPGGLNTSQAEGTIYLLPTPGSIVCGANQVPSIPLTVSGYCFISGSWVVCPLIGLIRPFRPEDLADVVALVRDVLAEFGFNAQMTSLERDLAEAHQRYAGERAGFWVAEMDGVVVGSVAVRPKDGATCEIKRLYLRADSRGAGLGQRLYDHAEAFARGAGYEVIWLDSSRRFAKARRLYERNGFVLKEEIDNDWEDNVYEKRL